jgi:uncharacterized protein (TIGR00288 family)
MQNFTLAPHRGGPGAPITPGSSPNAALLIDFDNVTMGIRSDLTRQLKELLNSDIIKGKVAVQRAYADWRRYAQYIVPLSEASVDLIFAPAYGSSKKNATDIRLAIDALELVFTRPEIGTYILLSGDSDFSSLVLKLKEYGKYVIGVGLRESASDLLVQNCDEYYSYSSLTGLTRAGDEELIASVDAWQLAERAVSQMSADGDVMRSDRLKQVMIELDPTFDEGQLGFTKFNKFLAEAASRNRIALKKLENGQYEVQPYERGEAETRDERPRGRGRRDRKDEPRARETRAEPESRPAAPSAGRSEGQREAPARGGRRDQAQPRAAEAAPEAQPAQAAPAPRSGPRDRRAEGIEEGYEVLRRAVRELAANPGEAARDSDIKRKILELEPGWDEATLGFTKFSRFLRQAHDADVVDLTRHPDGYFEARLSKAGGRAEPLAKQDREARRDRTRDRGGDRGRENGQDRSPRDRGRDERSAEQAMQREQAARAMQEEQAQERAPADGVADEVQETPDEAQPATPTEQPETVASEAAPSRPRRGRSPRSEAAPADEAVADASERPADEPSAPAGADAAAEGPATGASREAPAAEPVGEAQPAQTAARPAIGAPAGRPGGMGRRGRRGGAADGPPPLLPGQAVGVRSGAGARPDAEPAAPATPTDAGPPAQPAPDPAPEVAAGHDGEGTRPAADTAARAIEAPGMTPLDLEALGLPTEHGAVIRYLSNSYQGVGQKTAEALIEAFGADGVFHGLNDQPERVKEILGAGRRTDGLLNAWQRDYRRRTTAGAAGGVQAGDA